MQSDAADGEQPSLPLGMTMPSTVPECHAVIGALVLEVGLLRE